MEYCEVEKCAVGGNFKVACALFVHDLVTYIMEHDPQSDI